MLFDNSESYIKKKIATNLRVHIRVSRIKDNGALKIRTLL